MRISQNQVQVIVQAFRQCFGGGSIYLFGSRVDDDRRGGDIDLYVQLDHYDQAVRAKLNFLMQLKKTLGDRKVCKMRRLRTSSPMRHRPRSRTVRPGPKV